MLFNIRGPQYKATLGINPADNNKVSSPIKIGGNGNFEEEAAGLSLYLDGVSDTCIQQSTTDSSVFTFSDTAGQSIPAADVNRPVASNYAVKVHGSAGPLGMPEREADGKGLVDKLGEVVKLRKAFEAGGLSDVGMEGARSLIESVLGRRLTEEEWPSVSSKAADLERLNAFYLAEGILRGRIVNLLRGLVTPESAIKTVDKNTFKKRTVDYGGEAVDYPHELSVLASTTESDKFLEGIGRIAGIAEAVNIEAAVAGGLSSLEAMEKEARTFGENALVDTAMMGCTTPGGGVCASAMNAVRNDPEYEKYDKGYLLGRIGGVKKALIGAREALKVGDIQTARRLLLEVMDEKGFKDKEIEGLFKMHAGIRDANRTMLAIGGVIICGALAEVAAGFATPALVSLFGTSTAGAVATGVSKALIMGAVFTPAHKGWNAVTEIGVDRGPWKGFLEEAGEYGKEVLYMAGMFGAIGGVMRYFTKSVMEARVLMAARRLRATGELTLENIGTPQAFDMIMREAKASLFGKALEKVTGFGFEALTFQTWEYTKGLIERHVFGADIDPDAAWSKEAIKEGVKFLFGLKVGGFIARPITEPFRQAAVEKSRERLLAGYVPRLGAIQAETNAVLAKIKAAAEGVKADPEPLVDRLIGLAQAKVNLMRQIARDGLLPPEHAALAEAELALLIEERARIEAEKTLTEPVEMPSSEGIGGTIAGVRSLVSEIAPELSGLAAYIPLLSALLAGDISPLSAAAGFALSPTGIIKPKSGHAGRPEIFDPAIGKDRELFLDLVSDGAETFIVRSQDMKALAESLMAATGGDLAKVKAGFVDEAGRQVVVIKAGQTSEAGEMIFNSAFGRIGELSKIKTRFFDEFGREIDIQDLALSGALKTLDDEIKRARNQIAKDPSAYNGDGDRAVAGLLSEPATAKLARKNLSRLLERRDSSGNLLPQAQNLLRLLHFMKGNSNAWDWAFLAGSLRLYASFSGEASGIGTLDKVVERTLKLYEAAEKKGVRLHGSVYEAVDTSVMQHGTYKDVGSAGEVAVMEKLISLAGPLGITGIEAIPRSTPFKNKGKRTPDFKVTLKDGQTRIIEVKSSKGSQIPADYWSGRIPAALDEMAAYSAGHRIVITIGDFAPVIPSQGTIIYNGRPAKVELKRYSNGTGPYDYFEITDPSSGALIGRVIHIKAVFNNGGGAEPSSVTTHEADPKELYILAAH